MEYNLSALSPTRPFPYWRPRLKLAGPLVPLIFLTYFTPIAVVMRAVSFIIGGAFFGQPLIMRGIHLLTQKVPNWKDYLELRRYDTLVTELCSVVLTTILDHFSLVYRRMRNSR